MCDLCLWWASISVRAREKGKYLTSIPLPCLFVIFSALIKGRSISRYLLTLSWGFVHAKSVRAVCVRQHNQVFFALSTVCFIIWWRFKASKSFPEFSMVGVVHILLSVQLFPVLYANFYLRSSLYDYRYILFVWLGGMFYSSTQNSVISVLCQF
jgi:hypothetical protein